MDTMKGIFWFEAEAEDVLEGRQKKQQQPQDLLPHSAHKTVGMFGRKSELVNAIADHWCWRTQSRALLDHWCCNIISSSLQSSCNETKILPMKTAS